MVHEVFVHFDSGTTTSIVLRRWPPDDPADPLPGLAREPLALRLLEQTDIPAPRLLGTSDGDTTGGVRAVLMSRLPGRVDLAPEDPRAALSQMARLLVRIHDLDLDFPTDEPSPRPAPDDVPVWAERPEVWRAAQAALQEPPPHEPRAFVHADFQHFNVLWSRRRLTGIVDWAFPGVASPDVDVGHCRLNLAVLHGPERAAAFLAAYEAEAGRRVEPWWDLHRLTGYSPEWQGFIPRQVAGRIPVDVAGMTARVEETIAAALRRW